MAKSWTHKQTQQRAAGRGGYTEVRLSNGRYLDALTHDGQKATEVELSGDFSRLMKAAWRLKVSDAPTKVLQVPHRDISAAAAALRVVGVSAHVRNIWNTSGFRV